MRAAIVQRHDGPWPSSSALNTSCHPAEGNGKGEEGCNLLVAGLPAKDALSRVKSITALRQAVSSLMTPSATPVLGGSPSCASGR